MALALGQTVLDRRSDLRRGSWGRLAGGERSVILLDGEARAAAAEDGDGWRLLTVRDPGVDPEGAELLLGMDPAGVAVTARVVEVDDPLVPPGAQWMGLRSLGLHLARQDRDALTEAVALATWHRTHTHCPRCGDQTYMAGMGWWRVCDRDGTEHYPRTDPAVIALVIDPAENVLLARQTRWRPGAFSTLAGFVEPGESAESALRREVAEEVGLRLGTTRYLGSQPWPFPASLMLGYHAWVDQVRPEPRVDGVEIAEARWLSRAELAAAAEDGQVRLPGRLSIAHHLIGRWWGQLLPDRWCRW